MCSDIQCDPSNYNLCVKSSHNSSGRDLNQKQLILSKASGMSTLQFITTRRKRRRLFRVSPLCRYSPSDDSWGRGAALCLAIRRTRRMFSKYQSNYLHKTPLSYHSVLALVMEPGVGGLLYCSHPSYAQPPPSQG